jgi:hypothetical protein
LEALATSECDDDSTNKQIVKLTQAHEQTTTSSMIKRLFHKARLEPDTAVGALLVLAVATSGFGCFGRRLQRPIPIVLSTLRKTSSGGAYAPKYSKIHTSVDFTVHPTIQYYGRMTNIDYVPADSNGSRASSNSSRSTTTHLHRIALSRQSV